MTAPAYPSTWRYRRKPVEGAPGCTAPWHDSWTAYRNGCRCPGIVERVRAAQRRWRAGQRVGSTVPPRIGPRNAQPDEVAVLRVITGERMPLTTADRNAAIDTLDARGWSAARIARQIGCAQRTVVRRRTARANETAQHSEAA
jgi:hypothetical protein